MKTPLFDILKNDPTVAALLTTGNTTRVYPWGAAPQNPGLPYVTYGVYSGVPQNFVTNTPDIDNAGTQIDIWSKDTTSLENLYTAIRDAIEPYGHITGYAGTTKDPETQLYNARLEIDFWVNR